MFITGVLLEIIETSTFDIYASFHGNLDSSWNRELRNICGEYFQPESGAFRSLGGTRVRNREYPWTLGLIALSQTQLNYSPHEPMQSRQLHVYPELRVKDLRSIPKFTSSFRVVNMTIHSNFDPCNNTGDIALLEISPNMLTEAVPICMPRVDERIPDNLTATGFGLNCEITNYKPIQFIFLIASSFETRTKSSFL
ncbi:hypothetical protein DICVIV_04374 [Dictyocaulus viviparus]|uniref:Peptidase S1 domain-containing protein n=1 Tax=Dictyocaulus viviparus TaxID=29172 RepID=A0A0D8XYC3_DICVI|nr:hypothetical protein DICVIV_04374 [Dictyocaulus viviparus]